MWISNWKGTAPQVNINVLDIHFTLIQNAISSAHCARAESLLKSAKIQMCSEMELKRKRESEGNHCEISVTTPLKNSTWTKHTDARIAQHMVMQLLFHVLDSIDPGFQFFVNHLVLWCTNYLLIANAQFLPVFCRKASLASSTALIILKVIWNLLFCVGSQQKV